MKSNTLAAVALAIAFCRPTLAKTDVAAYAAIVFQRSSAIAVDPLLTVAVVEGESGWIPTVVNKSSGAVGLGQILPQYRPACVGATSSLACAAEKKKLLDGRYNLGVALDAFAAWQKECLARVGRAGVDNWLSAYAGLNQPTSGHWCGMSKVGSKWQALPQHAIVKKYLARQRALRLWIEDR